MASRWTEDEDVYLEYFAYEGDSGIQEADEYLNRSKAAVVSRLQYLRKKDSNVRCLKRKWSEKEDEFLRKNYRVMKNNELAKRLGRTCAAVDQRKKILELRTIRPITVHKDKIIELIQKGYYRPEIAKELNINEASLVKFLIINKIYCKPVPYKMRTKQIREINERRLYVNCENSK